MAQKGKSAPKTTQAPKDEYDPTVAETQRQLKQEGFFPYEVDGKAGVKTSDAIKARDAKKAQDAELELRRKQLEIDATKGAGDKARSDAEAAAAQAETARKQRYDEQASSGWGLATQTAANTLTPMLATAGGVIAGGKINAEMDRGQEGRNKTLRGAAADRVSGLTTREGARAGVRLAGAMPSENALLRVGARMAPHMALGGIGIGKGMQVLHESDPNGEFYSQMADRAAGLGWIGAGTGIMKQGIRYAASPGVSPDAQALAIINSNQLRRNGQNALLPSEPDDLPSGPRQVRSAPQETAVSPPRAGTHAALKAQAKELKIPGRSGMGKADLANAVADAIKAQGATRAKRLPKVTGAVGPALAAGLAYAATPDQANAADGSAPGFNASAAVNAGAAGGIAYGVQRGIDALPAAAGGAARMAGEAMAPVMVDSMTDYSPEEMATATNWQIDNLPSWALSPNVRQTAEMATVPERNPIRQEADFDSQLSELSAMLQELEGSPVQQSMASGAVEQRRPVRIDLSQPQPSYPRNRLLASY